MDAARFTMQPGPLHTAKDHSALEALVKIICSGRYFQRLAPDILRSILRQGSLIKAAKDTLLIREGDTAPPQIYILVKGSVAIISNDKFVLRLNQPGDLIGEMAVIQGTPRSADVVAESECDLVTFPAELLKIEKNSPHASVLYVLFSHAMAAKLRITTAQSLIRRNQRITSKGDIHIGVIDTNQEDRVAAREALGSCWQEAEIMEFDSPRSFLDFPSAYRFDVIVSDVDFFDDFQNDWNSISSFVRSMKLRGAHIIILSKSCNDANRREFLIQHGADDVVGKPCPTFDLKHIISRTRVAYYKNLELDRVESDAETDPLTGLANRRRLDQLLEALVTVYPENQREFSLIMIDVDNFKFYNDNQGHQMGDEALKSVATLLASNLRRGDLAARFGGEEFVIVVPDCGKALAVELAEKLRLAIEQADFPCQEQQPSGNLTVTLGVASFPGDANQLDALLKQADEYLFEGKRRGRNRVVSSDEHT